MIEMRNFKIEKPDDGMCSAIQIKIDNLAILFQIVELSFPI